MSRYEREKRIVEEHAGRLSRSGVSSEEAARRAANAAREGEKRDADRKPREAPAPTERVSVTKIHVEK